MGQRIDRDPVKHFSGIDRYIIEYMFTLGAPFLVGDCIELLNGSYATVEKFSFDTTKGLMIHAGGQVFPDLAVATPERREKIINFNRMMAESSRVYS